MDWSLIHKNDEHYLAEFSLLTRVDLQQLKKAHGWSRGINWSKYLRSNSNIQAFKLNVIGDNAIQGCVAIDVREGYVFIDMIEKAPNNRKPREDFKNAGDLLIAFACKISVDHGFSGYVSLIPKSGLEQTYLNKYRFQWTNPRLRLMGLDEVEAQRLIALYYIERM